MALIGLARGGLLHRHCIERNPSFEQPDDFANAEIDEEGAHAFWAFCLGPTLCNCQLALVVLGFFGLFGLFGS